jgi:hypothetical protein
MPLDAAFRQVFAPYRLGGGHGHQFWCKRLPCGVVQLFSKASIQKAQNRPSDQLIKATSCVEKSHTTIGAEELSIFSSYQMLTIDKNWLSYQAAMKIIKYLMVMTVNSG